MSSAQVPEGYKQTELGVIPEEWSVVSIGEIANIFVGKDVNEKHFSSVKDNKYKYPVYSNTVENEGLYGYYDYAEFFGNSLTVVGRGVGLGTAFSRIDSFGAIGRLVIIFPNKECNNEFLTNYINHKVDIFSESSGVPQLTGIGLAKYKVALPSQTEQQTIAQALSDVDALIASLDKLITKQRHLKTAAMQQLLTGKMRLPGFGEGKGYKQTEVGAIPEDWEVKKLGDVLKIRHGRSQHEIINPSGIYPILATGGEIGRTNTPLYSESSVLIGRKGTIDTPKYMDTPFWTVDTLFYSEISKHSDPKFIFYKFNLIDWYSYNEASGVPSLNAATIERIDQVFPTSKEEQRAIATVLSDMDRGVFKSCGRD
jgi:type I restriction enzyme, S subunit